MDKLIFEWLQDNHTDFLNQNMMNITAMGSTTILLLLFVAGLGYTGFILKDWKQAAYGGICVLLSLGTVEIGKYTFQRERPVAHDRVIITPNSPSMPSGHSAMSMTILSILALMIQKSKYWLIVGILASMLIGFSRMYLGVHWFTDVLVGWSVGMVYFYIFYSLSINNRYARVQAMG